MTWTLHDINTHVAPLFAAYYFHLFTTSLLGRVLCFDAVISLFIPYACLHDNM